MNVQAVTVVGEKNLDKMELDIRMKLMQRTSAGPFQFRKTFKYFDRDASGGIDLREFSEALRLLGFVYSDNELRELYSRCWLLIIYD